ncbi:hypothetical protein WH96_19990 [Kiloniella spongiae]|uniref:DUF2029 domain-containing protein n=1 Tax=Kiloniella spongiae TaxID=1489064 RepID=A0A0H2MQN5_9PROT|nr:glycosyltransferase family 87 protein [Kiloniella spongiae]KLN58980.1 hypothetical protein WH96_19990 [Kiloniella spongiae]
MAVLTLTFHIISIIAGTGLQTYFKVPLGADFLAFYTGGVFYLNDTLETIYDLAYLHSGFGQAPEIYFPNQLDFQQQLIGPDLLAHSPFVNPPFAALIYVPFSWLDYVPAYIAWTIFNLLALFIASQIIKSELTWFKNLPSYKVYLGCFLFFPTIACFLYSQATPIVLVLYCLCYRNLRNGNEFSAGFFLGMLAFKPQLAIGLAFVLLIKWRWRSLLGGITSVSLILGYSYLFMPDEMQAFLKISPSLTDFIRSTYYPTWGISSFFGFSVLLFDSLNPAISNILTATLTLGTLSLLLRLWKNTKWLENKTQWDIAMAMTFSWGILISPHLFYYDLMLLLLPISIVVQRIHYIYSKNNQIILWIIVLYISTYLGSQISVAQLEIMKLIKLPEISFQIITPVILYWGYLLYKVVMSPSGTLAETPAKCLPKHET